MSSDDEPTQAKGQEQGPKRRQTSVLASSHQ